MPPRPATASMRQPANSSPGSSSATQGIVTRRLGYAGGMDLGNPVSYLVLADGTPVLSSDGRELGKVEHVLADVESDVFDGVIVDMRAGPGGHRFADSTQVDAIYERGVVLAMTSSAAE